MLAPLIAGDPFRQAPINRLRPPSERWWFGTDQFGRDVFSRTVYGARVSLIVGLSVAALVEPDRPRASGSPAATSARVDGVVMRVMDGLMAIPSILLAIALITLTRPGLGIVIVAIVIPEVPRVVRVVRARRAVDPRPALCRERDRRRHAQHASCSCATSCPTRWRR